MSQKKAQKNMILVGIVIFAAIVSYQYFHSVQVKYLSITTFKACVDAGYKVISSYPEKCVMPGKSFINPLQKEATPTIVLDTPRAFGADSRNLSYIINNQQVTFVNGKNTSSTTQSSIIFEVTDKELKQDINNDSKEDVVLLLKMTKSGSNQDVYYITSAIGLNSGYSGANALYVDTDLKSSALVYKNGEIVLGYTTNNSTTTLKEKHYTFSDNMLKQITYK